MTTSMYCLYVGVDYTYIDVNALAQGIKSFLASLVLFHAHVTRWWTVDKKLAPVFLMLFSFNASF